MLSSGIILVTALVSGATSSPQYASDYTAFWECHHFEDKQDGEWCASVGFSDGFEYTFSSLPGISACMPCKCCKRKAIRVDASIPPATLAPPAMLAPGLAGLPSWDVPATTTTALMSLSSMTTPAPQRIEKHTVAIDGLSGPTLLAGMGGSVNKGMLTLKHNSGLTLFSNFEDVVDPKNMVQLKLVGKELNFTVDLSRVGCACNVALYLISSPGRDLDGKPYPGPKNSDQPPYYCDANNVGGQWCPEVDIMEANNHAFAATPHKCDAPVNGHYNYCDRDGCSQNTRDASDSYGPGASYTIDTRHPFHVRTVFPEESGIVTGMVTTLSQDGRQVVLDHANCGADLAALSDAMAAGMSLRITYWGESAETMAWLDAPPCGQQTCGASAGEAVISDIAIGTPSLPVVPVQVQEEHIAKPSFANTKHSFVIEGLPPALLAGVGGTVEDGSLTLSHNSGFTLFSEFKDKWEPENILQLKLLGKTLSFTVDLSKVGCACNVAFYLIGAPGRDWNGKPFAGPKNSGQPPYYCDANQVGGQWCPEVDIMEANDHTFAATPHKCDAPVNGHYNSCDRSGSGKNTRDEPSSYGPGETYTIDTRHPFQVETEFPEKSGILIGMTTTLRQAGRQVVLNHSSSDSDYLKALTDAMAAGMSLRITYWGDSADTMAWLDGPPCGQEACSATAGKAVISNVSVKSFMWVIADPKDTLFGREVPEAVVADSARFAEMDGFGIAKWRGATHFAKRQARPLTVLPSLKECSDDDNADLPCAGHVRKEANFKFLKKFLALPGGGVASTAVARLPSASSGAMVLIAACLSGIVSVLVGLRYFQRVRLAGGAAVAEAEVEANKVAAANASAERVQDTDRAGVAASGRLGLGRSLAHISHLPPSQLRKGSSCQQLLTLAEADL